MSCLLVQRKIIIDMRKSLRIALLVLLSGIGGIATAQVTYYSRGSGSWSDVNTWSVVSHSGAVAPQIPGELPAATRPTL